MLLAQNIVLFLCGLFRFFEVIAIECHPGRSDGAGRSVEFQGNGANLNIFPSSAADSFSPSTHIIHDRHHSMKWKRVPIDIASSKKSRIKSIHRYEERDSVLDGYSSHNVKRRTPREDVQRRIGYPTVTTCAVPDKPCAHRDAVFGIQAPGGGDNTGMPRLDLTSLETSACCSLR